MSGEWTLNRKLRDHPLRQFRARKGVSLSCPSCGGEDWVVSEPPEGEPVVPYLPPPAAHFGFRSTPVYPLFCENCGFLRMDDRVRVDSGAMSGSRGADGNATPFPGSRLPPDGGGPNDPDMDRRVTALEREAEAARAALARIEAMLTDLRRDLRETELPAIRAQLAGLEGSLRDKPGGRDFLALAQSRNGTLFKAFGMAVALPVASAGLLAWLHGQGVL